MVDVEASLVVMRVLLLHPLLHVLAFEALAVRAAALAGAQALAVLLEAVAFGALAPCDLPRAAGEEQAFAVAAPGALALSGAGLAHFEALAVILLTTGLAARTPTHRGFRLCASRSGGVRGFQFRCLGFLYFQTVEGSRLVVIVERRFSKKGRLSHQFF
jgi:hypothetical protein